MNRSLSTILKNRCHVLQDIPHNKTLNRRRFLLTSSRNAAELVDDLIQATRQRMEGSYHHVLAFSGGVDSSLVAALLQQAKSDNDRFQAVLGISPAVPAEQVELAQRIAEQLQIPFAQVPTTEGLDEQYVVNTGQACFVCKTHLYSTLQAISRHYSDHHIRLYNGTNADDLHDPTRVGLLAAQQWSVQSPLQYVTKAQVRMAARHLGLENWNYAASPCLRSRLALGVQATKEHLKVIEQAERHVRRVLRLNKSDNLRVRLLAGNSACIEVDNVEAAVEQQWDDYFLNHLGFASVSARAFRSGAVSRPSREDSGAIPTIFDRSDEEKRSRTAFG